MPTILVTGFGPFPGAPFNPTGPLVKRLARTRRPALADFKIVAHVFPTSYAAVDRELPRLIAKYRPNAILMFGLAPRAKTIRIETHAHNTVALLPDVGGAARAVKIAPGGPSAIGVAGTDGAAFGRGARHACAGRAVTRCRTLSVQLSVLARDRGDAPQRRPKPRRFCTCAEGGALRAAAGQAAGDDAGRSRPRWRRIAGDGRPPRLGRKAYLSNAHAGRPPLPPKARSCSRSLPSSLCPSSPAPRFTPPAANRAPGATPTGRAPDCCRLRKITSRRACWCSPARPAPGRAFSRCIAGS